MSDERPEPADLSTAAPEPSGNPMRNRHLRSTALIGVLLALLGFAIAVQLKSKSVDSWPACATTT